MLEHRGAEPRVWSLLTRQRRWIGVGASICLGAAVLALASLMASAPTDSVPGPSAPIAGEASVKDGDSYLLPDYRAFVDAERQAASGTTAELALDGAAKLAVVLAIILGATWAVKRVADGRSWPDGGRARLRVREALRLSPQATLYVVEVDGKMQLLGVTAHQVALLADLGANAEAADGGDEATGPHLGEQFVQALRHVQRKAVERRRPRRALDHSGLRR